MCKDCPCSETPSEHSEMAQNYGCFPSMYQILSGYDNHGQVWACHSNPKRACKGLIKHRNLNKDEKPTHGELFGENFNSEPKIRASC